MNINMECPYVLVKILSNIFSIFIKIYQNGLRELDMTYILNKLIFPVTILLLLMITAPYVGASLLIPLLGNWSN